MNEREIKSLFDFIKEKVDHSPTVEGKETPSAENDVNKMDPETLIKNLREDAVKSTNKQGENNMDSQASGDALATVNTVKTKDPAEGDKGDAKKDGQKDNPGEPSLVNKTTQSDKSQKAPSKNPGEPSILKTGGEAKESKVVEQTPATMPANPIATGSTNSPSAKPEQYKVIARGITDKVMADRMAVESKGVAREDDAQAGKWMVIVRENKFDVVAVAEKAFLVNFLKGKKFVSEREKKFIAENSKLEIPLQFKDQVVEAYRKLVEGCGWMKKKGKKKVEVKK